MIMDKYVDAGFSITRFGSSSRVLRYQQKPVFVFSSETGITDKFLNSICEAYLRINEKRPEPVSLKID